MVDFDVTAHLGIVSRQLGDSCRDSSKLDADRDRDSCRQFEPANSQVYKNQENNKLVVVEKRLPSQPSTTIPMQVTQRITTVSEQSASSPPTVSIPETIQVGSTVHKRHNFGWTGVVQAINSDSAEVLWYLDEYPSTIALRDLRLGMQRR